jgi:hypothetical protein
MSRSLVPDVRQVALMAAVPWLLACSPGERAEVERGAARGVAVAPGVPAERTGSDPAKPAVTEECPEEGLWERCNVEKRLERAGLVLTRREGQVRHPFLSVPGDVYENARVEVQVFVYPGAAERERDTDLLDSATVSPRDRRIYWRWPALLVTSNNLAAIVMSLNERSVERIALALGAGLPAAVPRREP